MSEKTISSLLGLVDIMATLRSPTGCPWDQRQTPETLKPYLLEETYEVLQALDSNDTQEICEELGDLLLQVVFLAQIFSEGGHFSLEEVAAGICEKLIRRHPHVFGEEQAADLKTLDRNWQRIKAQEKRARGLQPSLLGDIPSSLPALSRAQKIQGKAREVGITDQEPSPPLDHLEAKLRTLRREVGEGNTQKTEEALGELLFTATSVADSLSLDAESALRKVANKFQNRFSRGEQLEDNSQTLEDPDGTKMQALRKTASGVVD